MLRREEQQMNYKNASQVVLFSVYVALCVAALVLLFLKGCYGVRNSNSGVTAETTQTTDTTVSLKTDSTPIDITADDLKDTPTVTLVYIEVPAVIDTLEIIKKYFSCKSITYHYRKDSAYDLVIQDSSCMSELVHRNILFKNLKPDSTLVITNTINQTRILENARWYIGLSSSALLPFAPGVLYAHKKYALSANYDPFRNQFQGSVYIRIK
jgi:hypothetical protein